MTNNLLLGAATAALLSSATAQFTIPDFGSETFTSTADRAFGPGTSTTTNFTFGPNNGGAGFYNSSSNFVESRGTASSESSLVINGGISVPLLRTFAATNNGEFSASGSAVALEGYLYEGTAPQAFSLDVSLTGTTSNLDTDFAGNFAELSLWSGSSFFGGDSFIYQDSAANYFEFGFDLIDVIDLEQNGLNNDDVLSGTLNWTMNPGDTVYLHSFARSVVYGPNATANALSTLTTSFSSPITGLTAVSGNVVPEPTAALLSLLATATLLRRGRR